MASVEPPTYRLSRIPAQVSGPDLGYFLGGVIPDLDLRQIRVGSLAPTPDDHNRPPTQTATVQIFGPHPKSIEFDSNGECTKALQGHKKPLLIDNHFLGFTPLNHVDSGSHAFDLIALSGLASHPFGSWKKHGTTSGSSDQQQRAYMWLRDELPNDFPDIRVMIYGYDTKLLKSESEQTIADLAIAFNSSLKAIGKARTFTKPLLIFAHSLGGLLIKKALSMLAGSGETEVFMLDRIRLLMLFGVPGTGMKVEYLLPMVDGQPNESLIKCLSEADEEGFLEALNKSFDGISLLREIRLISAYETQRTRTAKEKSPGVWARIGEPVYLVSRASAIQKGSRDPQDVFPIDRGHSDMVKFTEGDVSYSRVKAFLHELFEAQEMRPEPTSTHSATIPNLSRSVTANPSLRQSSTSDEDALKSLCYQELQSREDQIAFAYKRSYEWLFDPEIGLQSWLQGTGRLFWIQGKPGSGKSTLMRHIQRSLCSEEAGPGLEIAHARSFKFVWFFFHARGSYLQKSFECLLRSILYQLGSTFSPVAQTIGEHYMAKPVQGRDVWIEDELLDLFKAIRLKVIVSKEVVLFLDALDEFYGHSETMADFLASMASHSNEKQNLTIRVLFSSRPRDVFVERFGTCHGFRLQDRTMQDIELYVRGRLRDIMGFQSSDADSDSLNRLTEEIKARAEGVFLWVKLVLDEFQSLPNRSPEILSSQLTIIPIELPDYYTRSIKQIAPKDRLDTFILLELLLRSPVGNTPLRDLFYAFRCAKGRTHDECRRHLEIATTEVPDDPTMCTRMKDLCCGLIEVVNSRKVTAEDSPQRVQFMHQTAKEYVSSPEFRQSLFPAGYRDPIDHHGSLLWTKYLFSIGHVNEYPGFQTRMCTDDLPIEPDRAHAETLKFNHRRLLCKSSYDAELSTGCDSALYLESVPENVFSVMEQRERGIWFNSRLSFALVAGLQLCVTRWLTIAATKDTDGPAKLLNSHRGTPLAHMFCERLIYLEYDRESIRPMAPMLQLLLNNGMDIQVEFEGDMPFQRLFHSHSPLSSENFVKAVTLMLAAGCSPNMRVRNYLDDLPFSRPLHACEARLVPILLKYGADINAYDSRGYTPLDAVFDDLQNNYPARYLQPKSVSLLEAGAHVSQQAHSKYLRELGDVEFRSEEETEMFRILEAAPVLKDRPTKAQLKALYADIFPPGDPKAPPHWKPSKTTKGKQVAQKMLRIFRRDK